MNQLNLPPQREMPADVRDRVWHRIETGMAAPARPLGRVRALAAAAAAVVILGLGVTGVAVMSTPTLLTPAAEQPPASDLARCHDAAARSDHVAPAERWRATLHSEDPTARVTGYIIDGAAVFCEITSTTTTVSRTHDGAIPAGDTAPRALLATPSGTVAGVVGTGRTGLLVSVTSPSRDGYQGPATVKDGLFLFHSPVAVSGAHITTADLDGSQSPSTLAAPSTPVVVTSPAPDVPATGATDVPARAASAELADCVARAAAFTASTPPTGAPALAHVESSGESAVLFLTRNRVDACVSQRHRADILTGIGTIDEATPLTRPRLLPLVPALDGHPLLGGILPSAATRMDISAPGAATVTAVVRSGTFAVLLPSATAPDHVTAQVFDATGQVLYNGPFVG